MIDQIYRQFKHSCDRKSDTTPLTQSSIVLSWVIFIAKLLKKKIVYAEKLSK